MFTAFLTLSLLFPVTNACKGSSSPGRGCPSFLPTLPSLTEPLPRIIILAPVYKIEIQTYSEHICKIILSRKKKSALKYTKNIKRNNMLQDNILRNFKKKKQLLAFHFKS